VSKFEIFCFEIDTLPNVSRRKTLESFKHKINFSKRFRKNSYQQVLRLEAQQRRKERQLLQKGADQQKTAVAAVTPAHLFATNGNIEGYCNGGPHPVIGSGLPAADVDAELCADLALEDSSQSESLRPLEEPVTEQHLLPQVKFFSQNY
jgi:hypothetical protein